MISNNISLLMNLKELQLFLSYRIKQARISSNLTQKELASRANISLSTYRRLEQKGEGSIKDFIKTLVALGRVQELENFLPPAPYSPVEEYEKKQGSKPPKQRVRHGS